ncbi:TolC family protein [Gemmata sp. JC673]|uniref:TolC family protein n=1 Tax=Gemmata algarum TaxID=2975278 RepID=A0ABU5EU59_9BACT|nr:TolC family protein [Gemmata algarum]MDY3558162.1 TolC family protein [Gemmata algarum]
MRHPHNYRRPQPRDWGGITFCVLCALAGCRAPSAPDCTAVSNHLTQRVGHTVPSRTEPAQVALPPGAAFEDGVTEDEAVAIALWNNAAFQELLVDLGVARGDLIQAGLLPNPEFVYYWPMADKPFKYLFDFPIEAIWLRPIRVKSAAREADRTAARLAQAGLDLMRDVRQAYADVVLAKERVRVAGESVKLRGRIAELAEKRLKAGDISPQEAATARIDALQAEQDATRIGYDVPVLEERLRNLMGVGAMRGPLPLDPSPPPPCQTFDADALTQEALATRPDAVAAAEAVAAAQARLTFARLGWVRFLGVVDATSGKASHVLGPALRFTVPLFNRNQGGIARAEAELERAVRNQKTVANQIVLDVQRSHLQYRQACAELDVLLVKVRPEVEAAIRRAQAAYQEGNVPIFIALAATQQLLDNYLREAVLHGDLRRFWAELERSAGRRLPPLPAPAATAPPMSPPVAPSAAADNPPSKFDLPKQSAPPTARVEPIVSAACSPVAPRPVAAEAPQWTPVRAKP